MKFNAIGPLPLLPVSAVQIRLSSALNPVPGLRFQLHGDAGHTTETRLCGPVKVTEPDNPWVEVKAGLAVKSVASVPNCDHPIESLALRPPTLVTTEMLSARAAAAANRIRMIAAPKLHRLRLYIDAPPSSRSERMKSYMHIGPASAVKVPLSENTASTAIEGVP